MPELLCANYPVNEWRNCRWLFWLDPVRGFDQAARFVEACGCIVIQRAERLPAFCPVPNPLVKLEAHGRVDRVFLLFPSTAQHHACHAQLLALRRGDESV